MLGACSQAAAGTPSLACTKYALTCLFAGHYSFAMAEATRPSAIDLELKRLEKRIDELLGTMFQLKEENRALRARQMTLANEKSSLLHRNEQVRTRVEAMIGRLKAMEHSA
jgi:cell division protein ZapB